ncbi:restriction endonuclease [Ralstonia solanacearum]|uniref:restriction endonuclease n=1 Tax=Ralstonia solanacearum TaxID=305 RepID=UPI000F61BF6C|nr:restriction endonuclease [Ralstonia solanacearum]
MAKRKDDNVLQGPFELARVLPWGLSLALAVTAYGVLHSYAVASAFTQAAPGQLGDIATDEWFKTLASAGQYLVPLGLLAGAAAAHFVQRKREQQARSAAQRKQGDALRQMSWPELERLLGQVFRTHCYTVTETGAGADSGVDLQLHKNGELYLVQCKQWQAYKVSIDTVRELLVDGAALTTLIRQAQAAALARKTMPGMRPRPSTERPHCPRCGNVMVRRTVKQGAKMGCHFWGCVTYPECRGTRGL